MPAFSSPAPPTLVHVLRDRALENPHGTAYVFLADGEDDAREISYRHLYAAAAEVAGALRAGHEPGERALLLFPPGLDYVTAFFGCLLAGVVAVPAYPPQDARGLGRLNAIVADAGASIALTTKDLLPLTRSALDAPLEWIAPDAPGTGAAGAGAPSVPGSAADPVAATPEDLAFLQYTSGSTRLPRGVMLTHANLVHNLRAIYESFAGAARDVMVSWLPPYHDMGLIGAILEPLYGGFPGVLMSPLHFLQKPYRWLKAISVHGGTISPSPNFGYELCLRKIDDAQRASLDLSSWRAAVNGAEPVRVETVERFTERFAPAGFGPDAFRPSYGLAEATLLVTADPVGHSVRRFPVEGVSRIACGTARGDQSVVVVDTATLAPAGAGQVGEVWVAGPSVSPGYWGRPTESTALFGATLPDGRGPYLRTGDLGAQDEEGALAVTGRLKDLLILRGRNVYPHDVEGAAERSHPALRPGCAAAFTVPVDGEERLVVVCEVADGADTEAVALAARRAVREECEADVHELVLIPPRTIPKTSSGKIQRRATREAHLSGALSRIGGWRPAGVTAPGAQVPDPPRTPLETLIAGVWAELLGEDEVGIHDDFFASGAQSLLLAQLAVRIEAELPVRVTAGDLFQASTVAKLAGLLESRPLTVDDEQVTGLIARSDNS
ncbi:AMP-binding protein [Streptomyces sp. SID486]|uniref:AMP-binding protein n=1 Tax=Streptomyces sp. SID486 TaxID=2690264 RepID=UPI00136C1F61|nr:AMP-binding protein [Streptomyces sp. SID486]MYX99288.1 AMP-binding protein [Streptomyces sp. SID486]